MSDSGWQSTVFTRQMLHSYLEVRGVVGEQWHYVWTESPINGGKVRNRGSAETEREAKRAARRCALKVARDAKRAG